MAAWATATAEKGPSIAAQLAELAGEAAPACALPTRRARGYVHLATMIPPGPIVSLVYRIAAERRDELLAFLADAAPFYERPGAIRVGLYESVDDPELFLELVAYGNEHAYAVDQERVERDPEMLSMLARFRAVVGAGVEVRRMRPVAIPRASTSFAIEPAAFNDHAAIAALLAECALPLPDDDDVPVRMTVARDGRRVIGCAGFERHGGHALLRSVAVLASERRRHVGRALVERVLADVAAEGIAEVYLLTTSAAPFLATHGFDVIERAALPQEIAASRQVATQCRVTATCMKRVLGA